MKHSEDVSLSNDSQAPGQPAQTQPEMPAAPTAQGAPATEPGADATGEQGDRPPRGGQSRRRGSRQHGRRRGGKGGPGARPESGGESTGESQQPPVAAPVDAEPVPVYAERAVVGMEIGRRGGGKGAQPRTPGEDAPKLHKVLADAGLGSRRDMEELIISGRVSVNGQPAHIGQRVGPADQVRVNGRTLNRKPGQQQPRVLLYHKPAGEITSRDDPGQRVTVFDRLPRLKGSRWVSVGRLDFNTEGLLVFTTSGDVANRLMHPRYGWEREYAVRVFGRIEDDVREKLLAGVQLEDGPASFSRIDDVGGEAANRWYRVVISEGRNREVRRILESVGLTVSRLVRIRFGPIALPRDLPRGRWAELSDGDVSTLMQAIRQAGSGTTGPATATPATPQDDEDRFDDESDADGMIDDEDDFERQPPQLAIEADARDRVLAPEHEDEEWQPSSHNAHLEGITRTVRKGEPGAAKAGGRGGRAARGQGRAGGLFGSGSQSTFRGFGPMGGSAGGPMGGPGAGGGNRAGNRAPKQGGGGRPGGGGKPGGPAKGGAGGKPAGGQRRGRRRSPSGQ